MPTVQEAIAALDSVTARKNATDAALLDAQAQESDLRSQIGRLVADGAKPDAVDAVRARRDQARQNIEDLEAAAQFLANDMAAATQAVRQAKADAYAETLASLSMTYKGAALGFDAALGSLLRALEQTTRIGTQIKTAASVQGDPAVDLFGKTLVYDAGSNVNAIRETLARLFTEAEPWKQTPVSLWMQAQAAGLIDAEAL